MYSSNAYQYNPLEQENEMLRVQNQALMLQLQETESSLREATNALDQSHQSLAIQMQNNENLQDKFDKQIATNDYKIANLEFKIKNQADYHADYLKQKEEGYQNLLKDHLTLQQDYSRLKEDSEVEIERLKREIRESKNFIPNPPKSPSDFQNPTSSTDEINLQQGLKNLAGFLDEKKILRESLMKKENYEAINPKIQFPDFNLLFLSEKLKQPTPTTPNSSFIANHRHVSNMISPETDTKIAYQKTLHNLNLQSVANNLCYEIDTIQHLKCPKKHIERVFFEMYDKKEAICYIVRPYVQDTFLSWLLDKRIFENPSSNQNHSSSSSIMINNSISIPKKKNFETSFSVPSDLNQQISILKQAFSGIKRKFKDIVFILKSILMNLENLHSKNLCHNNINLCSILIDTVIEDKKKIRRYVYLTEFQPYNNEGDLSPSPFKKDIEQYVRLFLGIFLKPEYDLNAIFQDSLEEMFKELDTTLINQFDFKNLTSPPQQIFEDMFKLIKDMLNLQQIDSNILNHCFFEQIFKSQKPPTKGSFIEMSKIPKHFNSKWNAKSIEKEFSVTARAKFYDDELDPNNFWFCVAELPQTSFLEAVGIAKQMEKNLRQKGLTNINCSARKEKKI